MRRLFVITLVFFLFSSTVWAGSFTDRFIDPEDGMFDTSEWLLTHRGFLPVPIIITEPAVDNGLGIALAFFHEPDKSESVDNDKNDKGFHTNRYGEQFSVCGGQHLRTARLEMRPNRLGVRDFAFADRNAQAIDEFLRCLRTDVGSKQDLLDLVDERMIEGCAAGE